MKSKSLRAALIAGGCAGVLVAISEIQRSWRGPGTVGYLVATIVDAALAFAVSALVWGLVAYAIATIINKRRLRKEPQLASGLQLAVHPARWLGAGAAIVVLLIGALVMSGAPKGRTATSAVQAYVPPFTTADGACDAFGSVVVHSTELNAEYEVAAFQLVQERSRTLYPEFSQEIAAFLAVARPTSDQLAAPLLTCREDGWLSDADLQSIEAQYEAARNSTGT